MKRRQWHTFPWRHERRVCWQCGAEFVAGVRAFVYCSPTCGRAARGCDEFGRKRRVAA